LAGSVCRDHLRKIEHRFGRDNELHHSRAMCPGLGFVGNREHQPPPGTDLIILANARRKTPAERAIACGL
jgi:hypothetical protein